MHHSGHLLPFQHRQIRKGHFPYISGKIAIARHDLFFIVVMDEVSSASATSKGATKRLIDEFGGTQYILREARYQIT